MPQQGTRLGFVAIPPLQSRSVEGARYEIFVGSGACRPAFLASGTAAPAQSRLVFDVTTIEVVTDKKRYKWRVQQAISGPQMAQGLMFRKKLDPWKGMLFDFGGPVLARIWMKNTEIPLDILFVKADGTIESIGFGEPFSLRIVRSEGPVRAVLEILHGTAQKLGIGPGDRIRHEIFGTPLKKPRSYKPKSLRRKRRLTEII